MGGIRGTMAAFLANRSPLFKVGAIAGGSWLTLAILSRMGNPFRGNDDPPGYVRDVYGRIDSGSRSEPIVVDPRALRTQVRTPSAPYDLSTRMHYNRIGHHRYGKARTDYQMGLLYR